MNNADSLSYSPLYAVRYVKTEKSYGNNELLKNDLPDSVYNKHSVIQEKRVLGFHIGNLELSCIKF